MKRNPTRGPTACTDAIPPATNVHQKGVGVSLPRPSNTLAPTKLTEEGHIGFSLTAVATSSLNLE